MQLDDWFEHARRDAVRRGLPDLEPLLDMLFRASRALRAADWAQGDETGTTGDIGTEAAGADAATPPGQADRSPARPGGRR